jgi:hypothetical protein
MYAKDTTVAVAKSRAEIEALLERHKAKQYGTAVDYEKLLARVQFSLQDRIVRFVVTLPDRKKLNPKNYERAERQRWRALLLVIKAKLESVESNIETFEHAFLSQIVMPGDQTVAEILTPIVAFAYKTGKLPQRLLGDGQAAGDPAR